MTQEHLLQIQSELIRLTANGDTARNIAIRLGKHHLCAPFNVLLRTRGRPDTTHRSLGKGLGYQRSRIKVLQALRDLEVGGSRIKEAAEENRQKIREQQKHQFPSTHPEAMPLLEMCQRALHYLFNTFDAGSFRVSKLLLAREIKIDPSKLSRLKTHGPLRQDREDCYLIQPAVAEKLYPALLDIAAELAGRAVGRKRS